MGAAAAGLAQTVGEGGFPPSNTVTKLTENPHFRIDIPYSHGVSCKEWQFHPKRREGFGDFWMNRDEPGGAATRCAGHDLQTGNVRRKRW